jgi:hypothetical protein
LGDIADYSSNVELVVLGTLIEQEFPQEEFRLEELQLGELQLGELQLVEPKLLLANQQN